MELFIFFIIKTNFLKSLIVKLHYSDASPTPAPGNKNLCGSGISRLTIQQKLIFDGEDSAV
jgi:hypothetical protein